MAVPAWFQVLKQATFVAFVALALALVISVHVAATAAALTWWLLLSLTSEG